MTPQLSRLTTTGTAEPTLFSPGLVPTCASAPNAPAESILTYVACFPRLMILVFTSTAFTNWVKTHVEITSDASFNPYLTFLFFAMYVYSQLAQAVELTHYILGLACRLCASLDPHSISYSDCLASKPYPSGSFDFVCTVIIASFCSIAGSLVHAISFEGILYHLGDWLHAIYPARRHSIS